MTAVLEQPRQIKTGIPTKLMMLFEPHRYKVLWGGRGSTKSWSVADALLLEGTQQEERYLCAREVQKSIKDSVHRLLCDQIKRLGLEDFYQIFETEIRGKNGTLFVFAGLCGQTISSIKSYEGITKCWIEEAQVVTKESWDILIPTIRQAGSEIWLTLNPGLDTDETWTRFVVNPPPGAIVVNMNYIDNPWLTKELEDERLHLKGTNFEDYENIWEGKPRTSVSGAIYAKELYAATMNGRICPVPYDPRLKVHTIWDLGLDENMAILFVQKGLSEIRIINYIQGEHVGSKTFDQVDGYESKTVDWYGSRLNAMAMNWGHDYLPHDGDTRAISTGQTAEKILKTLGRRPKLIQRLPVEVGIKAARQIFPRCYFDQGNTGVFLEHMKRYRRDVGEDGKLSAPIKDKHAHGADCLRYLALVENQLHNEDDWSVARVNMPPTVPMDALMGVCQ